MESPKVLWIFLFISIFCCQTVTNSQNTLKIAQANHRAEHIDERHFWKISNELSDIEDLHNTLSHILIERVPGTPGHAKVKNFIANRMRNLGWNVEENDFSERTPLDVKDRNFTNLIARLNPNAQRYLVLACHYDSKLLKGFVGATDSAVPCAIMINLAFVLGKYFETRRNTDLSLMFIFFDGEEAFKTWSAHDSLYGARHLAKKWEADKLKHIDIMVLLDLLGAPNPKFYDHFRETSGWYSLLVDIESRLGAAGALVEHAHNSANTQRKRHQGMFQPYGLYDMAIEDDHIPFLRRQVPILHIIPTPFPEVWHTIGDNVDALDFAAIENLVKVFGIFCLEYLRIDVTPFFQ